MRVCSPIPPGDCGCGNLTGITEPSLPRGVRPCGSKDQAKQADSDFDPAHVIGIGIDTTGSTPIPVDAEGTPLGLKPEFAGNLDAMVWLWKDHTGHEEAAKITELAAKIRPQYLAKCGGIYSSEWWWSKIWRCKNVAPDVFAAAHSWVEHCDWLPGVPDRKHQAGNHGSRDLFRRSQGNVLRRMGRPARCPSSWLSSPRIWPRFAIVCMQRLKPPIKRLAV